MNDLDGVRAEYETLRTEILQNDKLIQVMNLAAMFAIGIPIVLYFLQRRSELLLIPPFAFFVYLQMVTHKLEGTIRIAAYIATFIEPALPGLRWESALAQLRNRISGLPGVATHDALLVITLAGTIIPAVAISKDTYAHFAVVFSVFVGGFAVAQLATLKKLAGPEGYSAAWESLKH